jgi:hypothetical protein
MRLPILFTVVFSSLMAAAADPPSRRSFLQGAASVHAVVAMPRSPLQAQTDATVAALRMELRANRHESWAKHIRSFMKAKTLQEGTWQQIASPEDPLAHHFDRETFYDKMIDLEENLATEMGASTIQVAQAVEFMLDPTKLLQSALDGRLAKSPYPSIFTEAFVEKYLAHLKSVSPELEQVMRAEMAPDRYTGALQARPRGFILSLINMSEHARDKSGMFTFLTGSRDILGYHQPLEIALPRFSRAYLTVLQRLQSADAGFQLLPPSNWRDRYIDAVESIRHDIKEELTDLPRRLHAEQLESYRTVPSFWNHSPITLSAEAEVLLHDPLKWSQLLQGSVDAMNLLIKFVESEPVVAGEGCGQELLLEKAQPPAKQLTHEKSIEEEHGIEQGMGF